MTPRSLSIPALAALLISPSIQADGETAEPVVVTATRTAQLADETLAPVIVITREEIERTQANDVADLLRNYAGLDIARNGGPGQATSLFMRGTDSNHTLVMIDGVKINPGTIGGAALQNISPAVIERIEIVKGPRSALYGSEAIGGVINIITRSEARGTRASAGYTNGTYNTRNYRFSMDTRDTESGFRSGISTNFLSTGGFPTRSTSDIDRGYDNTTVNSYIGVQAGPVDVEASYWTASGNTEYVDFFLNPVDQDYRNSAGAVTLKAAPLDNWASSLKLSHITDKIDQNQSSDFTRTRREALDWQNDIQITASQLLTAGLWYSRENTRASIFGSGFDENISVKAAYLQDDIDLGAHRVQLAARVTDHEGFDTNVSWNFAYGYRMSAATRVTAAAGTAFRAPDSTDRFGFGGDPNLDPETSLNLELGLNHRFNALHALSLSAFDNRIEDLIEYNTATSRMENIGKARIYGLEGAYNFNLGHWHLRVTAIAQNPENDKTNEQLLRRAKHTMTASLTYQQKLYAVLVDFLATGKRKDVTEDLDAYQLVNATLQLRPYGGWLAQLKVENLLDENYELAKSYNTPERSFYFELAYNYR